MHSLELAGISAYLTNGDAMPLYQLAAYAYLKHSSGNCRAGSVVTYLSRFIAAAHRDGIDPRRRWKELLASYQSGFDDSELEDLSFLYPDWEVSSC